MLESNTNLLSTWQKLKAGSGNVTGQVVGQAMLSVILGGVGGVLSKGLGLAGRTVVAAETTVAADDKKEENTIQ